MASRRGSTEEFAGKLNAIFPDFAGTNNPPPPYFTMPSTSLNAG